MRALKHLLTFGERSQSATGPEPAALPPGVQASLESLIRLRAEAGGLALSPGAKVRSARAGGYRSLYRGRGIDFDEVRIYQPGDDIRTMDWRVTARTGEPHTKIYHEEKERPVLFVVDQGPSMSFGTRVRFKSVTAARAAALLAWAAVSNHDRVGGVVFSGSSHSELRPVARRRGVLQLCRALSAGPSDTVAKNAKVNALNEALARVSRIARPGSVLFLLSDFRGADEETEHRMMQLSIHNDVVVIFIYDPLEAAAPAPGRYPISDGNGFITLDTTSDRARSAYRQRFEARRERLSAVCRRHRMRFITLATNDPLMRILRHALPSRPH